MLVCASYAIFSCLTRLKLIEYVRAASVLHTNCFKRRFETYYFGIYFNILYSLLLLVLTPSCLVGAARCWPGNE